MIAFLRGTVAALGPDLAVLDVNGVGYSVQCTPGTLASLRHGQQAQLATSMVVREDSMTLYGFADDDERGVFELLQTASGVGPRLAQAMLAVHTPDDIRRAVMTEDLVALTKVPGIGRKGAQRIVLELKDRLGPPTGGPATPATGSPAVPAWREQVHAALLGLGWSAKEADEAVETVAAEHEDARARAAEAGELPPADDVRALLRAALRTLDRR
ncbi:MAG: Holliday junction branch migration protein RuvA [Actinomycetales bacterium]